MTILKVDRMFEGSSDIESKPPSWFRHFLIILMFLVLSKLSDTIAKG